MPPCETDMDAAAVASSQILLAGGLMLKTAAIHLTTTIGGAAIALILVVTGVLPVGVVSADSESPLACVDLNGNGVIDKDEVINVISAYLFPDPSPTPTPTATLTPIPTATPTPTATFTPTPTPTPVPIQWRGLSIAPEDRCSEYDSGDYRYPQSVEAHIVAAQGGIYGPYTGTWFDNTGQTDIEHIVARSEAHDSGLCAEDEAKRKQFSRDLLNLTLASPSVNRHQKRAKDAAEWLPDLNECWFVERTVKVREKYELTIDREEMEAIQRVLAGCSTVEMVYTERPTPTPAP